MSDRPETNREFLTEFIELYRSQPCLWHTESKQYRDQAVKNKSYDLLLQKYREVDPMATKQTVKSKINVLRTTYRKVLCKLNESIQSGATDDEVYKPRLWYFHLFDFLRDLEPNSLERTVRDDESEPKRFEEYELVSDETDGQYSSDPFGHSSPGPSLPVPEQRYRSSSSPPEHVASKKRKPTQQPVVPGKKITVVSVEREDPFCLFGKHVANKLRSLDALQNVFAQKLINDVVFEAEMESLNRGYTLVTENQPEENVSPETKYFNIRS